MRTVVATYRSINVHEIYFLYQNTESNGQVPCCVGKSTLPTYSLASKLVITSTHHPPSSLQGWLRFLVDFWYCASLSLETCSVDEFDS